MAIDNTESSTEERHGRIDEASEGDASTPNLRSFFLIQQMVIKIGKNAKKESRNMNVAKTIEML